jgi:hypothetical protein
MNRLHEIVGAWTETIGTATTANSHYCTVQAGQKNQMRPPHGSGSKSVVSFFISVKIFQTSAAATSMQYKSKMLCRCLFIVLVPACCSQGTDIALGDGSTNKEFRVLR